jgi:hypothetical protein
MRRNWIEILARELWKNPTTIRGWARQGVIAGVRQLHPPYGHYRITGTEQFRKWLATKVSDVLDSRRIPKRFPGEDTDRYFARRITANRLATRERVSRIVKLLGI